MNASNDNCNLPPKRVEITRGIVQAAKTTDANGTRPCHAHVGRRRFYVELVEWGGRAILADKASYEDAAAALAGSYPVHDLTMGGAA